MKGLGVMYGAGIVCALLVLLQSCVQSRAPVAHTAAGYQLEKLFTTPEGCNVYRFETEDYALHYMAACPPRVQVAPEPAVITVPARSRRVPT
jgi:hypothetical protein